MVVHEWAHGYTQTANDLFYSHESGAMNEAFSDIFGEAVDILNRDTDDTSERRTEYPTSCRFEHNGEWGTENGTDRGARWALGEDVTNENENGDGALRDMYKPECFFNPGSTYSEDYFCNEYDNGGVHINSGVLNRLFAVLVDGGEYENPSGGSNLVIDGMGLVKTLNLFYRAHETLTSTSQFFDFSVAINSVCDDNVGGVLLYPNIFNYTILQDSEILTTADCLNVALAVQGSGMDSTDDFCPNLDCSSDFNCKFATCPATGTIFYHEVCENCMLASALKYLVR